MSPVRTVATFRSAAFNTSETKGYFINESCFGDDLARWLLRELNTGHIRTENEPAQADFGWFLTFYVGEAAYQVIVGFRAGDSAAEGEWVCWLERSAGMLAMLLGARKRGIQPEAVQVIHTTLASSAAIQELKWHFREDFDAGHEEKAAAEPLSVQ